MAQQFTEHQAAVKLNVTVLEIRRAIIGMDMGRRMLGHFTEAEVFQMSKWLRRHRKAEGGTDEPSR